MYALELDEVVSKTAVSFSRQAPGWCQLLKLLMGLRPFVCCEVEGTWLPEKDQTLGWECMSGDKFHYQQHGTSTSNWDRLLRISVLV